MSHTVKAKVKCKNAAALAAACVRLGLELKQPTTVKLFAGNSVPNAYAVQLPGWSYPLAISADTGEVSYDNYNGHWGAQSVLDGFLNRVGAEAVKLEARRRGQVVQEKVNQQTGEIELTVTV